MVHTYGQSTATMNDGSGGPEIIPSSCLFQFVEFGSYLEHMEDMIDERACIFFNF